MARRSGLGRGLDSLIPAGQSSDEASESVAGDRTGYREVPVGAIDTNRFQPRQAFDVGSLETLRESIAALGVLQPLLVRPAPEGRFELVAGERRLRAAKAAGLERVPVLVRELEDQDSLEQAVVENVQREDLNPIEEAAALQQLLEEFSLTQEQVAAKVGRSRPAVANAVRLLHLPIEVQELLVAGRLSAGHARALLTVSDTAEQVRLAVRAVERSMTVRDLEAAVRPAGPPGRGGDGRPGRSGRPSAGSGRSAAIVEVETQLAELLATRVSVLSRGGKGRIILEFADLDDLGRIFELLMATTRAKAAHSEPEVGSDLH